MRWRPPEETSTRRSSIACRRASKRYPNWPPIQGGQPGFVRSVVAARSPSLTALSDRVVPDARHDLLSFVRNDEIDEVLDRTFRRAPRVEVEVARDRVRPASNVLLGG